MIAFLVFAVIGGIASAGISLLAFGAGFWIVALWYILGNWAGFTLSVVAFLLTESLQQSDRADLHTKYG